MLETNSRFVFLDYFRIPHRLLINQAASSHQFNTESPISSFGKLTWKNNAPLIRTLYWPHFDLLETNVSSRFPNSLFRFLEIPIFGQIVVDHVLARWLRSTGVTWTPINPIRDETGKSVASIWRDDNGNICLPFNPNDVILNYWCEAYQLFQTASLAGRVKTLMMRGYYRIRPVLPRAAQIRLRRVFSHFQERTEFPRWPIEPGLQDFYDWLFITITDIAGVAIPWLAPWPAGYSWAMVLTHDVETAVGYEHIDLIRDVEIRQGYRSSWNFVPRRYAIENSITQRLVADGFEIGVHGLYHDGRDLESPRILAERLPAIREAADKWNAVGFRSPATHRVWELMPQLGFDYDSSYFDTDPFEPQSGGCCSLLPFLNDDLVELPMTLPQDHTLFVILLQSDEHTWVTKAQYICSRGGMALLNTHPDYMQRPGLIQTYERFLSSFANDPTVWRVLPKDISAWWRRRMASDLVLTDGDWKVVGPAASDGTVRFTVPITPSRQVSL